MKTFCDVLVVGAGVAGVPAAVAAARAGADTLLVEQRAYPGGTGVAGRHRQICGLFPDSPNPSESLLQEGIVREVVDGILAASPSRRPARIGKVDVLPCDPDRFQQVFRELLANEKRLNVLFHTVASGVLLESGLVTRLSAGGMEVVPRVVVDCSGDGAVIQSDSSLHEALPAAGRQLAGCMIRVGGLAGGVGDVLAIEIPYFLRRGVSSGRLPPHLRFTTVAAADVPDECWLKMSVPAGRHGAGAEIEEARLVHAYLAETSPVFAGSRIIGEPSEVLEREGVRLKGLYTLTEDDVVEGRRFEDAAARGAWPIEIWDPERGPTFRYLTEGASFYEIPMRSLRSAAARNLLCAGRCISATPGALGSVRVMGTCMALGEAAGREAAGMAK